MFNSSIKIIIYTAIENNYDFLKPLPMNIRGIKNITFVCFSNTINPGFLNGWMIHPNPSNYSNPTKRSRYVKVNPHILFPNYDCSLWIDGNIVMTRQIKKFIMNLIVSRNNIVVIRHPIRNCIYDEGLACIAQGKEGLENWSTLEKYLKSELFPTNAGLVESNVIFRLHNNKEVVRLLNLWWFMIENYSHRDQLSFNYAANHVGVAITYMSGSARGDNSAFFSQRHRTHGVIDLLYIVESYAATLIILSTIICWVRFVRFQYNKFFS